LELVYLERHLLEVEYLPIIQLRKKPTNVGLYDIIRKNIFWSIALNNFYTIIIVLRLIWFNSHIE